MKLNKDDFKNCLSNIDSTKYRVSWTLTKLLAAVILVFIFVFSVKGCMNKSEENRELKRKLEEMERKRLETDAIKEEVKKISEYTAYEFDYTEVIHFSDKNEFYGFEIPLTGNNFIATIDGKMNIGIDGEKVTFAEEKNSEGKVIKVELFVPHSEILDNYTIQDSLQIYDETNNIFNPVKIEDYAKLIVQAEEKEEKKVLESDIIEKSDEAVHYLLTTYFKAVYGEDVKLEYKYLEEE